MSSVFMHFGNGNNMGNKSVSGMFASVKMIVEGNRERAEQIRKETEKQAAKELNRILNKFRSGKKLTGMEMDFVAKHSPETYPKILRITQERRAMEAEMKQADSKEEVRNKETGKMGLIAQMSTDEFEQTARFNQCQKAFQEYRLSMDFQKKEDVEESGEEKNPLLEEEDLLVETLRGKTGGTQDINYGADGKPRRKKETEVGKRINKSV